MYRSVCFVCFTCVLTTAAQESPKPQYTARELFYSAATPQAAPAKEAPKPAAPAPKKAAAPKKPAVTPPPVAAVEKQRPAEPTASAPVAPSMPPASSMIVRASMTTAPAPATGTPLGIKYTVLKEVGDDMVPVPPDSTFRSGDRLQLSVQTNGPGYLYVISQGSSGTWQPIFPSPEVADGDNHVDGFNAKLLPPGSVMALDERPGMEHLFIVFSRVPEDGLENMIYSLKGGAVKPAAGRTPDRPARKLVQIADANIDDGTVGRLRDTYTRDLIIEKVNDKTPSDKPGEKKEDAEYVVNPTGSSDSRVVADIKLVHQ